MTALIPLHFDHADVRMVLLGDQPWWVLNDICAILEIANPRNAAKRLEDYQKGVHTMDTLGGRQEMVIVNEPGIYALTMVSRKPEAKAFAQWLFTCVLPSIRKHGCYPPPEIVSALPLDDEGPWDGQEKTIGERFREERERWESETGFKMAGTIPLMSKPVVRAIEDNLGGIRKGDRILYLLYAGIDVLYVMTGQRTLTPSERTLRDAYRVAVPEQRQSLLARAEMLKLVDGGVGTSLS